MALINYVKKDEATGAIASIYEKMEQRLNILPNVLQFHTASPGLYPKLISIFDHFIEHERLDVFTIAYTRLLVSHLGGGEYCVRFQSSILKYLGVSEENIEKAKQDSELLTCH